MPTAAKGTSRAAAKAFVRHYFDVLNTAMTSGDTKTLKALSGPDCASCDTIAGNIEETYEAGGSIESRGWIVYVVSFVPEQPRQSPILDLGVRISPERVRASAGAEPKTFRGGRQPMTMYLSRRDRSWQVDRLDRVA